MYETMSVVLGNASAIGNGAGVAGAGDANGSGTTPEGRGYPVTEHELIF